MIEYIGRKGEKVSFTSFDVVRGNKRAKHGMIEKGDSDSDSGQMSKTIKMTAAKTQATKRK